MIGVVGDDQATIRSLLDGLDSRGEPTTWGPATEVVAASPETIITVGEAALLEVVARRSGIPVLPIDADPIPHAVSPGRTPEVAEALLDGDATIHRYPLLDIHVDGHPSGCGLLEAMLITSEPSRITEYRIETASGGTQFRADGVVVATALGSHGYPNAAGGPLVVDDTEQAVIVPVAAFAVHADSWIVDPSSTITLRVLREDAAVSLVIDGRDPNPIQPHHPVEIVAGGEAKLVALRG